MLTLCNTSVVDFCQDCSDRNQLQMGVIFFSWLAGALGYTTANCRIQKSSNVSNNTESEGCDGWTWKRNKNTISQMLNKAMTRQHLSSSMKPTLLHLTNCSTFFLTGSCHLNKNLWFSKHVEHFNGWWWKVFELTNTSHWEWYKKKKLFLTFQMKVCNTHLQK